jgi:uncharacterized membrane protein YqaE (UPF0057 family)
MQVTSFMPTSPSVAPNPRRLSGEPIVFAVAAAKFLLQILTASRYGYFIDEFYYYSCSEHLQWGYVDHPPLVAGLMWITTHLFGHSLLGIRLVPALLGALLVWVVGVTTRELGGGRFAQALAACSVLAAPIYMLEFHFFSMNAVEPVLWTACALAAIRAIRRDDPRYWILFGILCGLGMENKYSAALLIAGIFLGLLATPARRAFVSVHFWIGLLLALLIFLPNLLWLVHHQFPFLQWRSTMAQRGDTLQLPAWRFIEQQFLWTASTCLVWLAGLGYFLFAQDGKRVRFAGIAFVCVIVALILMSGKSPYASPLYGFMFAGGGVYLERATQNLRSLRVVLIAFLLITGAILAPCFVPILPIDRVVAYQNHIPLPLPIQTESYALQQKFPQVFSLETGWEEMVSEVADVYHRLPPAEQSQAGILTFHYGTAGSVDLLGAKYGLPKPISTAMTWHMWGPRGYTGETLILVGPLFPAAFCKSYEEAPPLVNPYMYDGVGLKGPLIHVCHGLKFDLQKHWEGLPWY